MPSDQSTVKATQRRWPALRPPATVASTAREKGIMLQRVVAILLLTIIATVQSASADTAAIDWPQTVSAARGQTVYFNAWGGSERINDYIAWVGERVAADYGITLRQVKLADTADAVARVLAEKTAGKTSG